MKAYKTIIIAAIAFLGINSLGCQNTHAEKLRVHTIKKDKHTATNRCIRFVSNNQIRFDFFVSSSWLYDEKAPGFQSGWNKLIGISEGFNQHKNSVRVGWRCIENTIYLSSYCYINGERRISDMVEVPMGWNTGSVTITATHYRVQINDRIFNFENTNRSFFKFMLYPYFGGNSKAPHDMEFKFRLNP